MKMQSGAFSHLCPGNIAQQMCPAQDKYEFNKCQNIFNKFRYNSSSTSIVDTRTNTVKIQRQIQCSRYNSATSVVNTVKIRGRNRRNSLYKKFGKAAPGINLGKAVLKTARVLKTFCVLNCCIYKNDRLYRQ